MRTPESHRLRHDAVSERGNRRAPGRGPGSEGFRDSPGYCWRKGDIVIWDNRCSYHKAAGDYPPEEDRIHWRVSIKERVAA